jgi:glycosyltransferase involved in cell wall biosynthesis
MGVKVAFITRDFNGQFPYITPAGCAYYRCLLPMTVAGKTARMGMPAWDSKQGFGVKETETTGIFGFDTVVLKLIMDRWTPKQIEMAQALGQKIIIDIDDFHEGLTPANKAYDLTDPEKNKKANREYYEQTIEMADMVIVSTPFLQDHYMKKRDNVHLIRNGVSLKQFTRRKHRSTKPVIGWAGAVNYRNNDLEMLRYWLPDFLEKHDLMFHHAGHEPNSPSFADITWINPNRLTTSPLVAIQNYADGFKFDIGIVPLNDIPFNHAKSNIKGLEYMAAGIPFIASDLPEYRFLHENGVGRIATTTDDWEGNMQELLTYRVRKQEAGRSYGIVASSWNIESRAKEWNDVLERI